MTEQGFTLQVYRIRERLFDNAQAVLQDALPEAKISPSIDRRQLLVWARTAEHESIQNILNTLDQQIGPHDQQTLVAYGLKEATRSAAQSFLNESLPGLQYIESNDPTKLLIRARADQHAVVERLLKEFEQANPSKPVMTVEVYPLDDRDADRVQKLLDPDLLRGLSTELDESKKRADRACDRPTTCEAERGA